MSLATCLAPLHAGFARVVFDPNQAAQERKALFAKGWHCVGLWHTHPEPQPHPSSEDWILAKDHAIAARGQLTGLVFGVLGTSAPPAGLRIWVHDGKQAHELKFDDAMPSAEARLEIRSSRRGDSSLRRMKARIRAMLKRRDSP